MPERGWEPWCLRGGGALTPERMGTWWVKVSDGSWVDFPTAELSSRNTSPMWFSCLQSAGSAQAFESSISGWAERSLGREIHFFFIRIQCTPTIPEQRCVSLNCVFNLNFKMPRSRLPCLFSFVVFMEN